VHGNNFKLGSEPQFAPVSFAPSSNSEQDAGEYAVQIRRFTPADAPALLTAARESVQELCAWMTWCRPDYSLEHASSFIAAAADSWNACREFSFAIVDSAEGRFLGSVGINHINRIHNFANLGYWVRRTRTRQGIASAAVSLAVQFAFRKAGLNRLEFLIPAGNVASKKVALKAGALHEGTLRNRLLLAGQFHDAILYSMLRQDAQAQEQDRRVMAGASA
jgi:ribosomal-protein-serine acetyltransferase